MSLRQGEMVEWSITVVLKTTVPRGTGGSNPSLSAINAENQQIAKQAPNFTPKNVKLGVFVLFKKKPPSNTESLRRFLLFACMGLVIFDTDL